MTKIEWCDDVLNSAWGCRNNCNFCYAKKLARIRGHRIGKARGYSEDIIQKMINFEPVFFPDYEKIFEKVCNTKKKKRIFVDSMSDICCWESEWLYKVLNKVREYPQHMFIFLTKDFDVYADFEFPQNCWLGYTIINQKQMDSLCYDDFFYPPETGNKFFISIEPIQEFITIKIPCDWVITGIETGNRKEKIIPKLEWIESLYDYCKENEIPFFMKDSLKKLYNQELIQQFPEEADK